MGNYAALGKADISSHEAQIVIIKEIIIYTNEQLAIIWSFLQRLSVYQNRAAKAVRVGDLGTAHINLKTATIKIFQNVDKVFDLQTSLRLFLTFFRAAFYLENKSGEFAYRYQAIPGQLGNACHFQLGLSRQDASGYNPKPDAVIECATAAHKLLENHAESVIVQSTEQRRSQQGTAFRLQDLKFTRNTHGFPIVSILNSTKGKMIDFSRPRIFDYERFRKSMPTNAGPLTLLEAVEQHMYLL